MLTYKNYTGTVEYSQEDECLFGRIMGINDIITFEGESVKELRMAFEEAVEDFLLTAPLRVKSHRSLILAVSFYVLTPYYMQSLP